IYVSVMRICTAALLFLITIMANSSSFGTTSPDTNPSHFIGLNRFSKFKKELSGNEVIWTSPEIKSPIAWDELVVSWNATAPSGTYLKIEARGIYPDRTTRYYTMGLWSENIPSFQGESVKGQKDSDGKVSTDTLILMQPCQRVQIRVSLGTAEKGVEPKFKFLGLSFWNSKATTTSLPANKKAWGKIIETPERSQNSYPEEEGWCSPTSLAMVLMRWSEVLQRPDLNVDVRECAAGVYDKNYGTGNWPFNTAYAGRFAGIRAYVTRFTDISELEDWIASGIPVIISAPFHLLESGRKDTGSGHVITCIGFTKTGDVVINDPATNLNKGQKVRHIYKRENVINAWKKSNNTVYLVYPASAKIPKNRLGHWEKK
ncbi:MAG: C39 family peptidase, partial [Verrucomicrobiota bacterium]